MARGHRLNTSIVLAAVYGLSGLFRAVSAVDLSLSRPLPTLSPSLIGHLASVDVKQHESIAFRHLPPNSARFSYATEGALFISAELSSDAVSALRKVRVLI